MNESNEKFYLKKMIKFFLHLMLFACVCVCVCVYVYTRVNICMYECVTIFTLFSNKDVFKQFHLYSRVVNFSFKHSRIDRWAVYGFHLLTFHLKKEHPSKQTPCVYLINQGNIYNVHFTFFPRS